MSLPSEGGPQHKADVRTRVWEQLRKVAYPDSRFHYDFSSFIADFQGSDAANDRLLALMQQQQQQPCLFRARGDAAAAAAAAASCCCVFIAPDNCLEYLREKTLAAGVTVLTTSYGIRRGFRLLDPAVLPPAAAAAGGYKYAATLDGMEKVATPVSLADIVARGLRVGMMVTGTGAIDDRGVRFGKGHGYFDLEWAMLSALGVAAADETVTAAVVHDCQVLRGEVLVPEPYDTVCDLVVTPTTTIDTTTTRRARDGGAAGPAKPTCGVLWDRLEPNMLEDIPPLRELKAILQARETESSS